MCRLFDQWQSQTRYSRATSIVCSDGALSGRGSYGMGTKRVAQQRLQWPAQWTGRPSSHTFPPALGPSASPSLLRLTVIDQPPTPSRNCQLGRAYFFDPQAFRLTDGSWEDLVVPSICSRLYSRHAKSTAIAFFLVFSFVSLYYAQVVSSLHPAFRPSVLVAPRRWHY